MHIVMRSKLFLCLSLACAVSSVFSTSSSAPKAIISDRCTAIAVGRKATKDGSTMTTHTADCADCDWRIAKWVKIVQINVVFFSILTPAIATVFYITSQRITPHHRIIGFLPETGRRVPCDLFTWLEDNTPRLPEMTTAPRPGAWRIWRICRSERSGRRRVWCWGTSRKSSTPMRWSRGKIAGHFD